MPLSIFANCISNMQQAIKNKTFCQETLQRGSVRCHPLKHCLVTDLDPTLTPGKLNVGVLNTVFSDLSGPRSTAKESCIRSQEDAEQVVANFISAYQNEIATWVEACYNYETQHPSQKLDKYSGEHFVLTNDLEQKPGKLLATRPGSSAQVQKSLGVHPIDRRQRVKNLPNNLTIGIDIASRKHNTPVDIRFATNQSYTVVLNYNPTSPYGFDICTVVPQTQNTNARHYYEPEFKENQYRPTLKERLTLLSAIRLQPTYQAQSISEHEKYLLMALQCIGADNVSRSKERLPNGKIRNDIRFEFTEPEREVYHINPEGIRKEGSNEPIEVDDPALMDVAPELLRYLDMDCTMPRPTHYPRSKSSSEFQRNHSLDTKIPVNTNRHKQEETPPLP